MNYVVFGIVLAVGITLAVVSLFWSKYEKTEQDRKEDCGNYLLYIDRVSNTAETHIDVVLKDYETMNREIQNRGTITLGVGAILVAASFLILGNTATNKGLALDTKFAVAIVSILLYILWLFVFHDTTKKLDNMTFSRLRAIEKGLRQRFGYDFGIHTYLKDQVEKTRWIKYRRPFWVWILVLLFIGWGFIVAL